VLAVATAWVLPAAATVVVVVVVEVGGECGDLVAAVAATLLAEVARILPAQRRQKSTAHRTQWCRAACMFVEAEAEVEVGRS
jgi:hypothetical protein